MNVLVYDTQKYDRAGLTAANANKHQLAFIEAQLNSHTVALATNYDAVSIFVNDDASAPVLKSLAANGTKLIALRSTGFNNVDLKHAAELGIGVMRVANYSPYAVAEHAVALLMTVNRKIYRAHNRTREITFRWMGCRVTTFTAKPWAWLARVALARFLRAYCMALV